MGGDHGCAVLVEGAQRAAAAGVPVLLVGDEAQLGPLQRRGALLPVRHAADVIGMAEAPALAVRRKPQASVVRAITAVNDGLACAAVSCGSTGATMTAALLHLGRAPGIERPALATVVPRSDGGRLVLLDLGANVDSKPEHLAQFALMGEALARTLLEMDQPRVGLLSNGSEEGKGNELVRAASPLIAALSLEYVGNIEPEDALRGHCDVLVCDGFVGNIMLKTVEATAAVVGRILREEVSSRLSSRIGARLASGVMGRFRDRTDAQTVGGALLLGVNGAIVVGHGRSDARAVEAAVTLAWRTAEGGLHQRVSTAIAHNLG